MAGKHTKVRQNKFTLNLLSRRRALLTVLYTSLMVLFTTHSWIILAVIFALMAIFELFLAVETSAAEAAAGKEQEIAMAGLAQLQSGSPGDNNPLHHLFNLHRENNTEASGGVAAGSKPQTLGGYL